MRTSGGIIEHIFTGGGLTMATRLDGFYYARYEGMNPDGTAGQGVVVLKDGQGIRRR